MSANSDKFLRDLRQAGTEIQAEAKKTNPLYLWYAIGALFLLVIIMVSCNSKDQVPATAAIPAVPQQYQSPVVVQQAPTQAPVIVNNDSGSNAALHMATGAMLGAALANNNRSYDDDRYYRDRQRESKKTTIVNNHYVTQAPAPVSAPKMFPNITPVPKQTATKVDLTKPSVPNYGNTWASKPAVTPSYKPTTPYKSVATTAKVSTSYKAPAYKQTTTYKTTTYKTTSTTRSK